MTREEQALNAIMEAARKALSETSNERSALSEIWRIAAEGMNQRYIPPHERGPLGNQQAFPRQYMCLGAHQMTYDRQR